jgi:HEPN domain-containing protein
MAADKARAEDVRAWLRKASLDLRAAEHAISAPEACLWADIAFHAQQATEKCLKAFLAWHDVPFRKTHNLEELGRECVKLDCTLQAVVTCAVPLTEYAWKFRYPGEPDEPSREEAERALRIAREAAEEVANRLPEDVRRSPREARTR